MAELEDDLARLAPEVDVPSGLAALRSGRDRRNHRRMAGASALIAVALVLGGAALWQLRASPGDGDVQVGVAVSRPAGEPVETPVGDLTVPCDLTLIGRFVVEGLPGVVLRNDSGASCTAPRVTAAGRTADDTSGAIPNAAWNDQAQREMPSVLAAGEELPIILLNRPWPCPSPDPAEETGFFEMELRVGRQRFALAPNRTEPWPTCGIAIAVLEVLPADAETVPLVEGDPGVSVDDSLPEVAEPGWELVTREETVVEIGTLAAATSPEELVELWETHGLEAPLPEMSFADAVVVAITIADDACPPELIGFDLTDEALLTPVFVEPGGGCDLPLVRGTYVVALGRELVGDAFVLRLPAADLFYDERRLSVFLAGGVPPCQLEFSLWRFGVAYLTLDTVQAGFVNATDRPCRVLDVTMEGVDREGTAVQVPRAGWFPEEIPVGESMVMPATIDPGDGFTVVLFNRDQRCLIASDLATVELTIDGSIVDLVPGLAAGPVPSCGVAFDILRGGTDLGVVPEYGPLEGRVCLLSNPPQCNDPLIRFG
jgi:hypothetical protein